MPWFFKGEKIKDAREVRDISQAELARRLGVKPQQLGQWENGKVPPGQKNFIKICNVLECPPKFFFAFSEDNNPQKKRRAA